MTNKEAIEKLKEIMFMTGYKEALNIAIKTLEEQRPQGEWIITGEEQGALGITYKIRKCDKCGWEHSLLIPDNYCPNCGADMRGKNNGN